MQQERYTEYEPEVHGVSVCRECGALVNNRAAHDAWHLSLADPRSLIQSNPSRSVRHVVAGWAEEAERRGLVL